MNILLPLSLGSLMVTLAIQLPSELISPILPNTVLLAYLPFVALFYLTCLLLYLLLRYGNEPVIFIAVIMFSILFFTTWGFKIPGGVVGGLDWAIFDHWKILQQGGFHTLEETGYGPAIFTLVAPLTNLFGLEMGFLVFFLVRPIAIASFSYLIARKLTGDVRISSLAAMLSMLGNPFYITPGDSIYASLPNGIIFFLVGTYLLIHIVKTQSQGSRYLFLLLVVVSTLVYPLVGFLLTAEIAIIYLTQRKTLSEDFGSALVYSAIASFAILVVWHIFTGSAMVFVDFWLKPLFEGIQRAIGVQPTDPQWHFSELLRHATSFLGHQSPLLAPFSVLWPSVVYLVGSSLWLWSVLKKRGVTTYLCLPSFLIAIVLAFTRGGIAPYRLSFYLGIFLSITLLTIPRLKGTHAWRVLTLLLLFTTLPTLASYLPNVGSNSTVYPSSYAAGTFLSNSPTRIIIFTWSGTMMVDRSIVLWSAVDFRHYLTGADYMELAKTFPVGKYETDETGKVYYGRIMTTSPMYYANVEYSYGHETALLVQNLISERMREYSMIYNNGVTSMAI